MRVIIRSNFPAILAVAIVHGVREYVLVSPETDDDSKRCFLERSVDVPLRYVHGVEALRTVDQYRSTLGFADKVVVVVVVVVVG